MPLSLPIEPAATKLLQQQRTEQNGLKRDELIGQLQTVIAREVPVIPSWQGRLAVVAHNDIENVQPAIDPLSFVYFSGMRR